MQQNKNIWQKQFNLNLRNRLSARQVLIQANKQFNNGKNEINYHLFIPVGNKKQLFNFIKYLAFFHIVIFFSLLFHGTNVKDVLSFLFSGGNILLFSWIWLLFYLAARKKIIDVRIYRKKKMVVIDDMLRFFGGKIKFEWHSNNYLPELNQPEIQKEKYAQIRQNLQQAIELETGLKFDTQQFLLQYKEKLGI